MNSRDNHTDRQDFSALRGFSNRTVGMTKNMAANPQKTCISEIWAFRDENDKIMARKPAESMHFHSGRGTLQRNKNIL